MKKNIEHIFCDRCKKEITNDFIYHEPYNCYLYDLCSNCFKDFEIFNSKVEKIKNKWEKLEKEYKFGSYLPKNDKEQE